MTNDKYDHDLNELTLVIENDDKHCEDARFWLDAYKMNYILATTEEEAWEVFHNHDVKGVISDIHFGQTKSSAPRPYGLILALLCQARDTPIPFIFVTSNRHGEEEMSRIMGAIAHLKVQCLEGLQEDGEKGEKRWYDAVNTMRGYFNEKNRPFA